MTPWTASRQAPLSMGSSRQESWSGSPDPPPGDLPDPGMEATSPALEGGFSTPGARGIPSPAVRIGNLIHYFQSFIFKGVFKALTSLLTLFHVIF